SSATWSPGPTPRAWSAAATRWASSWSRPQATGSWPPSPTDPTKVMVPGDPAPASRRDRTGCTSDFTSGDAPPLPPAAPPAPPRAAARGRAAAGPARQRRRGVPEEGRAGEDPVGAGGAGGGERLGVGVPAVGHDPDPRLAGPEGGHVAAVGGEVDDDHVGG